MIGKNLKKIDKMSNKNLIRKVLKENINFIKQCNILCIGDIILDHYIYGNIEIINLVELVMLLEILVV